MKAKEYLEQIKQADDKRLAMVNAIKQMAQEVLDIAKSRNATKDSALIAIYKEQEKKYISLCLMVNKENFDFIAQFNGFQAYVKLTSIELYNLIWK